MQEAVQWLCAQTGTSPEAIGFETPRGVLVDAFIERGFAVFAVNPKQADRFRDRFSVAGAKDDPGNARILGDALRDRRAFRRVRPDDPLVIQLREDLQEEENRLTNRLRDQLYRVDAAWLTISPAADEPWLWTLLAATPDPERWAGLPRRTIAAALCAHRIRRTTADQVVQALRQPRLTVMPGVTAAAVSHIAPVVAQLRLIHALRTTAEHQIDRLLARLATSTDEPREHRDVEILQSLLGVGRIVATTMPSDATSALAERDYEASGPGRHRPGDERSGKRLWVHMRYACKGAFRQALYQWARTSVQHDAGTRVYFRDLLSRGHRHGRALRSVGDRWLRILIAMLKTGKLYDATRFAEA